MFCRHVRSNVKILSSTFLAWSNSGVPAKRLFQKKHCHRLFYIDNKLVLQNFWQYNVSLLSYMEHQKYETIIFNFKAVIFSKSLSFIESPRNFDIISVWEPFTPWKLSFWVWTFWIWRAKIFWTSCIYLTQSVKM